MKAIVSAVEAREPQKPGAEARHEVPAATTKGRVMTRLLTAAGLLAFAPSVADADCRSIYDSDLNAIAWSEMRESRYTLCYDTRLAQDVELAERWVDNAFNIAERKYNVVPPVQRRGHDLEMTIFLVPHPTSRANRSTATVTCCSDSVSLEIHIMSPSAPDYGRPEDDFIKTLTHEMMNALHYETREPPNMTPPRWVLEGLAEYEGYYGTTSGNRAKVDWLIEYVHDNLQGDILYGYSLEDGAAPTIVSVDRYYGSAVVMIFFAEQFGEEIHYKFFQKPINDVLTDYGFGAEDAFRELDAWLDRKYLAPPPGTSSYTPHVTCAGRYWRTDAGRLSFEVQVRNNEQRPANHGVFQQQYRPDGSRPWTTEGSVALVSSDRSGFSTPLFTSTSSRSFEWRARSCPMSQTTDRACSEWSNTIHWTPSTCARVRVR